MDTGDITCRGNNPAPAAANDDRLVEQRGIIALFDAGIKGIAIDMCKAEAEQFRMLYDMPGLALRAVFLRRQRRHIKTIPTEKLSLAIGP